MVRPHMRRGFLIVTLLGFAGCPWRGYGAILAVHLDVLTQTANKLVAVAESGRGISAQGMAEYVYPAQRGREFLRQFRSYQTRDSYQQFAKLLDEYEALVHETDTTRAEGKPWREALPGLARRRDAVLALATATRDDLHRDD
jgi:hypothetical protein